jgi:hypothetical protein
MVTTPEKSRLPTLGCRVAIVTLLLGALLGVSLLVSSRSGSDAEDPAEKNATAKSGDKTKTKGKKKKKPAFEFGMLRVQPNSVGRSQGIKPGHWTTASQRMLSNDDIFVGSLRSVVAQKNRDASARVDGTPYGLAVTRPAQFPKGKPRYLETLYFAPHREPDTVQDPEFPTTIAVERHRLRSELYGRGGISLLHSSSPALVRQMQPHEYHLVVLCEKPEGYRSLQKLDSVRPPSNHWDQDRDQFYVVSMPIIAAGRPLAIPSHPLSWSSLAYVLWDDLDPNGLSLEQQQSMVDWLHWGGQLIVSGPKSLDKLQGSFLADYLPAKSAGPTELKQQQIDIINADWCPLVTKVEGDKISEKLARLTIKKPWVGIKLEKIGGGRFLLSESDHGRLIAERRVGRGRVIATAFGLSEKELQSWSGFDGFFNGCLLRRGRRRFSLSEETGMLVVNWAERSGQRLDPRHVTAVRYLSRDDLNVNAESDSLSVGGWDDFSGISEAARQSLRTAAGVKIPGRGFVATILAVYLIVLAPINWVVFRAIGRVEWVWIAAPILSIGFGVAVVRLAQLDIGFVRAKTEFAVIEAHSGYSRAHVTRYTALYSSLSTGYDIEFDDPSALALPFATGAPIRNADAGTVSLHRGNEVTLRGFNVASNSTGMLHSEQMFELGGAISLRDSASEQTVVNESSLDLRGAVAIHRINRDTVYYAWIGELSAGQSTRLRFSAAEGTDRWQRERAAKDRTSPQAQQDELSLAGLLSQVEDAATLSDGEIRLVAWTDQEIPGVRYSPASSQKRSTALVVVHLRQPKDLDPKPDRVSRFEARVESTINQ